MSVFDHVYYTFHHDHINTPLITPLELQMVGGGVSHENWGGGYNPPGGVWINQ